MLASYFEDHELYMLYYFKLWIKINFSSKYPYVRLGVNGRFHVLHSSPIVKWQFI